MQTRNRSSLPSRAVRHAAGELVDVSDAAAEARFIVPVALTNELYTDICDLSGEYVLSSDDASSRLRDLLAYARVQTSHHLDDYGFVFTLYMPVADRTSYRARLMLHGGDDSEDVITISKDVITIPKEKRRC